MSNWQQPSVRHQPECIDIPISPGELVNRLTLLELESDRARDAAQRMKVISDWSKLAPLAAGLLSRDREIVRLKGRLRTINETLNEIDAELREHERRNDFGPRFVALARAVYHNNDQRIALQRDIDRRSTATSVG